MIKKSKFHMMPQMFTGRVRLPTELMLLLVKIRSVSRGSICSCGMPIWSKASLKRTFAAWPVSTSILQTVQWLMLRVTTKRASSFSSLLCFWAPLSTFVLTTLIIFCSLVPSHFDCLSFKFLCSFAFSFWFSVNVPLYVQWNLLTTIDGWYISFPFVARCIVPSHGRDLDESGSILWSFFFREGMSFLLALCGCLVTPQVVGFL